MDARKIIQRIMIFLVFEQNVSSLLTIHTENVSAILQDAKRIILNCTYENDSKEIIWDGNIRWKKQIKGVFEDLAFFFSAWRSNTFYQRIHAASLQQQNRTHCSKHLAFSCDDYKGPCL